MARRPRPKGRSSRYFLGFGLTAVVLGGMTLFLVLVILPRRYLLSAGLRESGVSFPSEAAPFTPPEEVHQDAPPPPPVPQALVRGPAEVFWSEVEPLLDAERFSEALPIFEDYLRAYPEDRGVRREYAITLSKARHAGDAINVFQELLAKEDDPGIRLLLARELRDLGGLSEASVQYSFLVEQDPENLSVALEWGRALAWEKEYDRAAEVLAAALSRDPSSVEIGAELARVYYWSGRLDEADRILAGMDTATLEAAGAVSLREDVTAALAPPASEEGAGEAAVASPPPTLLEQAAGALAEEDYGGAARLYQEALRETPDDTAAWHAYADVLQYQLEDLEGARVALLRLEELGGTDFPLRYRLAQLEMWTGRNEDAMTRLQELLGDVEAELALAEEPDSSRVGAEEVSEIRALLGDLSRWEGDRTLAADYYESSLAADSTNPRAEAGLEELKAEAVREIEEAERPGLGGNAYSLMDSDEFSRLDLGVQGIGIGGNWVWSFRTGNRWLRGLGLESRLETEQGLFLEMESARWWGWGTVRSGVHFGIEELQTGRQDFTFGASLFFRDLAGFDTGLRYDHGPAYPLTVTIQSLFSRAVQDRFTATLSRRIDERWSLTMAGDVGRISSSEQDGTGTDRSVRTEGSVSFGRFLTDALVVGLNTRALTYNNPAPVTDGVRLFWDPRGVVAGGVFAQWTPKLAEDWRLDTRFNPSMAFIDERTSSGYDLVPHLSAELGISHLGRRFLSSLDAFYYQGRFDGYRAYGMRVSISARNWFGKWGRS
ncbi:MAG: tetratricopeptide repeat protein [Longimicrobiales bacterium]